MIIVVKYNNKQGIKRYPNPFKGWSQSWSAQHSAVSNAEFCLIEIAEREVVSIVKLINLKIEILRDVKNGAVDQNNGHSWILYIV